MTTLPRPLPQAGGERHYPASDLPPSWTLLNLVAPVWDSGWPAPLRCWTASRAVWPQRRVVVIVDHLAHPRVPEPRM